MTRTPLPPRRWFKDALPITSALACLALLIGGPFVQAQAASPVLRVVILDSAVKVRPAAMISEGATRIELEGARNEFETAQVVLSSSEPLQDVRVQVGPLDGPGGRIPAGDVELFLVQYVTVDAASDARGQAGQWPDPLVRLRQPFALQAQRHQPVFMKVFLRPDLKPGVYTGALSISAKGVAPQNLEVRVDVWNLVLPERVSLPFMTGVDFESVRKFEGGMPDPAFEDSVVPKYYRALRASRAFPLFLHNGRPDVDVSNGRLTIDFTTYRRRLEAAYAGRSWGPIGVPFTESWPVDTGRYPLFSDEYRRLAVTFLRDMASFYERLGVLGQTFLYIPGTDEPIEKRQYDLVRQFAELARTANPRLRLLLTSYMECMDCRGEGIESLEKHNPLWVPNLAFFDNRALRVRARFFGLAGHEISVAPSGWTPAFAQRVKQRGGEVWWYVNPWTSALPAEQQPAYPNLYIDHPGIEHRVLGWMAFKYRVGAISHWNATYWQKTSDPWARVPRGEEAAGAPAVAGDGSLLYPATGSSRFTGQPDPDGPVVSLRLEMLREGSEDHELLSMLEQRGRGSLAFEISSSIVRGLQDFERSPQAYRLARRRLAAALAPSNLNSTQPAPQR